MRIVFMGTPDFAVPTLKTLAESEHEVVAVYTQPDKPKGRGHAMQFTPVKEAALDYDIPVYQPEKVRNAECIDEIRSHKPDAIIVVAYGQILPKELLNIPKFGCINVHASLLPKYRGAAPIQFAILGGETVTGVTAMFMDVELDTGDMLKKVEVPMDPEETGGSLHDKLCVLGGPLVLDVLKELEEGTAVREPQNQALATYCKKLDKSMGKLDFSKSAVELERLIRGLNPWPCAYTTLDGKLLKLWKASVIENTGKQYEDASCGAVVKVDKDGLHVKTAKGILVITELQLEGKKRMAVDDFLRGYQVMEGIVLG